ncbi:hypothetical protein MUK42_24119 [Musa troglodytarum]|uniref:Uncharacterized protein n=1 Tax=Musa troglodytarum TaxID=320322 RepID=A0A9E7JI59_9LILI|nr:hypothetical protein MUK42_24119 [Musa troglodytarum]
MCKKYFVVSLDLFVIALALCSNGFSYDDVDELWAASTVREAIRATRSTMDATLYGLIHVIMWEAIGTKGECGCEWVGEVTEGFLRMVERREEVGRGILNYGRNGIAEEQGDGERPPPSMSMLATCSSWRRVASW